MNAYDNGAFVTVRITANDVETFNHHWPCSCLPARSVSFVFDKSNGDLVDIEGRYRDRFQGAEAAALADDAWAHYRRDVQS